MTQRITEQQAADLLLAADNILLLAHHYPDGDTIGSNYALCLALRALGKQVRVLCGDPIPERFDYMTDGVEMPDFAPAFICAVDVADPALLDVYAEIGCEFAVIPYLTEEYRPGQPKFAQVIAGAKLLGNTNIA